MVRKLFIAAISAAALGGFSTAQADIVHNDDVIIIGSLCVGFDCVNGESFGFDTLRLKENNLRIHFLDTSTAASFPTNDWRIRINDSSNGGGSYFAVEDASAGKTPFRVDAGARNNALYVDPQGDIGIGTNNPAVDVDIKTGNTPTVRLQQDGTSGFTPQTWDVAGNEAGFFVRDATNGSTLPLRIRPGVASSALDIHPGEVGIGTSSPSDSDGLAEQILDVKSSSGDARVIVDSGDGAGRFGEFLMQESNANRWAFGFTGGNDLFYIYNYTTNKEVLTARASDGNLGTGGCGDPDHDLTIGGTGAGCNTGTFSKIDAGEAQFTVSSSRSLKTNLKPVEPRDVLTAIEKVGVYKYDFIGGPKDKLGLMAEDFHQVFERGSDKMISGQDVQMALWLAVQELTAKVKQLESEKAERKQLER